MSVPRSTTAAQPSRRGGGRSAGRTLTTAAFTAFALLFTATASAKVIAQGYSYGPRATATATGTIKSSQRPSIAVMAKPAGRVTVNWDTICAQTFAPLSTSGAFTARTPVMRVVTVPEVKKAGQCVTTVEAVLHGSGSLTVEVLLG